MAASFLLIFSLMCRLCGGKQYPGVWFMLFYKVNYRKPELLFASL